MKDGRRTGDWNGVMDALESYQKIGISPDHISLNALSKRYHVGLNNIPKSQFAEIYNTKKIDDSNREQIIEEIVEKARNNTYMKEGKLAKTDKKPSTITWDIQFDGIEDKRIIDELKRRGYVIYQKIIKTELKEV
jgi:hypothetical protein